MYRIEKMADKNKFLVRLAEHFTSFDIITTMVFDLTMMDKLITLKIKNTMTLLKVNQPNPNGWMNDFLNDLPSVFGKTFTENSLTPQVNILEKNDAYLLELSAPGRTKEDFKINIDKNLLTISYEKKDQQKNENEKYIRKEFNVPSFKRSFTLDDKIDADNIKAKYENGLLIFDLPKKAEVKATAKEIVVE